MEPRREAHHATVNLFSFEQESALFSPESIPKNPALGHRKETFGGCLMPK
jgi:hypothetical protein